MSNKDSAASEGVPERIWVHQVAKNHKVIHSERKSNTDIEYVRVSPSVDEAAEVTTPLADVEGSQELKPCPFCKGRAVTKDGYPRALVRCVKCSARTMAVALAQAVEQWNTRSLDASGYVRGQLKAVDDAIDIVNQSLNADDAVAKLEEQRDALISPHQETK